MTTKISDKEMGCMKNLSNAASSLTAIVNTFDEHVQYKNMSDVHQELLEQVQPKKTLKDHKQVQWMNQIQMKITKARTRMRASIMKMTISLIW